jgi:CheY-like chemotaxis protein
MFLFLDGVQILTEKNGLGAVNLVLNPEDGSAVDLVIMDNGMPIMTGVKAYMKMREIKRRLPIVIISGNTNNLLEEELLWDNHLYVLQKPFSFPKLIELSKQLLKLDNHQIQNQQEEQHEDIACTS